MIAPYQEDFFQRIVNVQWGGGAVFVYGTLLDDALYYVKFQTIGAKPVSHTIVPPGAGDSGLTAMGSSYARVKDTPVFLICGNKASFEDTTDSVGNPVKVTYFHTFIYYSNDGLNWSIARQEDGVPSFPDTDPGASPVALVWDSDVSSFYYDQYRAGEQVFSSADGVSWGGGGGFLDHCSNNDCFDALGQHVPDGVMIYDTTKQITAKPVLPPITFYDTGEHSFGFSESGETWGSSEVEVTQHAPAGKITAGTTTTVSIPGVAKVFCVAGANGIFMAGGGADPAGDTGAVALSLDGGQTWTPFATHASSVTTMIAAPMQHLASA